MKKDLFLVDLTNIIYRNFFAFMRNPLRNSKGINTSAIFGTSNFLLELMDSNKIEYIACTIDLKEPTFRHQLYHDYKSGREKAPDELLTQIPVIYEIVENLGIKIFSQKGYESDDILASLTARFYDDFGNIYLVTSDKDMGQLIDQKVKILYPKKENGLYPILDVKGIQERLNIKKEQIIDYFSLIGDSIDNVPGIEGIGPKTAERLLSEMDSLDNFFTNPSVVKNEKIREKLLNNVENLKKYRELIRLKKDANLKADLDDLKTGRVNEKRLKEIFKEYEIFSLMKRFEEKKVEQKDDIVKTDSFEKLLDDDSIFVIKVEKRVFFGSKKFLFETDFDKLDFKIFEKLTHKILIFENFKDFVELLENLSDYEILDINTLSQIQGKNANLKRIVEELYGENFDTLSIVDLVKKFLSTKEKFVNNCKDDLNFPVYNSIELPIIPSIVKMEKNGIKVDVEFFKNKEEQLVKGIEDIEKRIYEITKIRFNINSSKQVSEVLFEKMNLKPFKKGKTGFSTDYETLLNLRGTSPVIDLILQHREFSKLLKGYVQPILNLTVDNDIIHTTFEQSYAATGRFSSRNPNLQNVPEDIREGFIVRNKNNFFVSMDYSQIELRVLAFLSQDKNLNKAFEEGRDIHSETAKHIFGVENDLIDERMRSLAKIINFSVIYGKTSYGLSQELNIPKKDAENFIKRYFQEFFEVRKWIDETIKEAKKSGYVKTFFGRCRYIPEILSSNKTVRSSGERMAVNTPIQGTAADIMKMAIKNVYSKIKNKNDIMMILTIHDELVFEIDERSLDRYMELCEKAMVDIKPFDKILKVNVKKGKNWKEI